MIQMQNPGDTIKNREDLLEVSIYATQSRPNGPNMRKWSKTG